MQRDAATLLDIIQAPNWSSSSWRDATGWPLRAI